MRYVAKDRKKLLMISGSLFIICGMALGYALLSSSIKINGTGTISTNWDILFMGIEEKSRKGATTNDSQITDKLTATFDVDLDSPGSYIEYNVTLKNNGNTDAVIAKVTGIEEVNSEDPTGIQFKVSGIRIGDDLLASSEKTFVVRAEIPGNETTLPSGSKILDLKVEVRQKEVDSSGLVTTLNECFRTNEAGDTITKYLCSKNNTNGYSEILDVNIPKEINGHTITQIGSKSFSQTGLTAVIIPDTITTIGAQAFFENSLKQLHLPNSVKTIGAEAFVANALTELVIPNTVNNLGSSVFRNNRLPIEKAFIYNRNNDGTEDRTTLNSYAGANRDHIVIPEGITTIGTGAFHGCGIKRVTLPNHLRIIDSHAFFSNLLTEITFPETLTEIHANALASNKLTNLILPRNLVRLNDGAFSSNVLNEVTFLGDVPTELGSNIFQNNGGLTAKTIRVPAGMLEQYQQAQGKRQGLICTSSQTWFGQDDESLLDAFYE